MKSMFRISVVVLLFGCSASTLFSQMFGGVMIPSLESQYPAGSVFCASGPTAIVEVTNPTTGRTWMDRNLGASQVATSSTDAAAYGDLYQWGRRSDGHQCRNSGVLYNTLSSIDQPLHGQFIIANTGIAPYDWRSPQNTNLWQGVSGINNPCPSGYRLPTETELNTERLSWSSNNAEGAFASPLKLPMAGERNLNGILNNLDDTGCYYTSTIQSTSSKHLLFQGTFSSIQDGWRGMGRSVRCIKDTPATLGALNCGSAVTTGALISGQLASGVSTSLPYTGGNGGSYSGQSFSSIGVTGLTATLATGSVNTGSGSLVYTITGTPATSGTASFAISVGGQSCTFTVTVTSLAAQYPAGSVFCASGPTAIVEVTNPTTGRTWMDRNLGASQVATSSTDAAAYGDLYQWGRRSDGHQCRTSGTIQALSSSDSPGHGLFIMTSGDWRSTVNNNLWQGLTGVNNPCPSGFRVPTETELNNERLSWSSNNPAGAYGSVLKLPAAGYRDRYNGNIGGAQGTYWSSNINSSNARYLYFFGVNDASFISYPRGEGTSVRCIKN